MDNNKIALIPGERYLLKCTGEFSHAVGKKGFLDFSDSLNNEDTAYAIFIGCIASGIHGGLRNIFFIPNDPKRTYMSFGVITTDYVIKRF